MKIVGVGCGPGLLTEQAIRVISEAEQVYGSKRAIDAVRSYIPAGCPVQVITDYRNLHQLPDSAVILSTGDPMLAGLGYLPGEVIPGISSLQVAAARLHLPLDRVSVVLAHGRDHSVAIRSTLAELDLGKVVFLIPDPDFHVGRLCEALGAKHAGISVIILENLGYPDEKILRGSTVNPPAATSDLFSIVVGNP